jgi:hypothetical protein
MWPIYDALFKDHGPEHDLILDKIFERLPKFVNLATIVCHGILCTNRHLIDLSKFERLEKLDITDDRSVTLRVSSLTISSRNLFPIDEWFSYFRPDFVSVCIGDLYTPILPGLVTSPSIIRHLESLSTTIQRDTLPLLSEVLSHCPPLQSLRLSTAEMTKFDIRGLSFTPSPLLRTFQGPYELLHTLSTAESLHNLRHLELPSLSVIRNNDPDEMKQAIMSLGESAARLEILRFAVRYLTEDLLKTVIDFCSNLKKLSISVIDRSLGPPNPDAYTVQVCILVYTITVILTFDID